MDNISPLVIGGVGGSGTRAIAGFFMELGYCMGDDLNVSNDNLTFTLLFKRLSILFKTSKELQEIIALFTKVMYAQTLSEREESLLAEAAREYFKAYETEWISQRLAAIREHKTVGALWGWKEPNSHIVLEHLHAFFPKMKYIHVVRNGLDMAYSSNQIQLKLWGKNILSKEEVEISARNSLKYWRRVHERVEKMIRQNNIDACFIDFDSLCLGSVSEREKIVDFLGMDDIIFEKLDALLNVPDSIGRHKEHSLDAFDREDIEYVQKFMKEMENVR